MLVGVIHQEFFYDDLPYWNPWEFLASINEILERMMKLEREFLPSKSLILGEDDVLGAVESQTEEDDEDEA